ncbi:MAG TPA: 16S rRNA (adenine(1518)-N(6)/adenine(1519)-N(6))-dimethyltransferase RsmA [Gemmatimonadales bacterium]|nr:16S rRNA (adenine(1518)-N(6)/adenine(1519)-N(6))-dimethyltransferase RsmA [Gemmatimonadales bacterium]
MPPAKRRLGQHFLTDPRILTRIADASGAATGDTVLEIGPGTGGLTEALAAHGARIVAIERDVDLIDGLRRRVPIADVVEGDALDVAWYEASGSPDPARWVVTGNIPYNITSPLLERALTPPIARAVVFLVQEEVADRLAARPGTRDWGALTVGITAVARVEKLFTVRAGAFKPPPKVDSALVRLTPLAVPLVPGELTTEFRRFVTGLFGFRRKQLGRGLRELTGWPAARVLEPLSRADLEPTIRPEQVDTAQMARLFGEVVDAGWRSE